MGNNNGKDSFSCSVFGLVIAPLALAIYLLKTTWWLLLVLAVAAAIWAFTLRRKEQARTASMTPAERELFYTQECPHCGAQVKVNAYDSYAHCEYCGSGFPAAHEPLTREQPAAEGAWSKQFRALVIAAVILAVLGAAGLSMNLADRAESGSSSSASSSSAVSRSNSASASSSVASRSTSAATSSSRGTSASARQTSTSSSLPQSSAATSRAPIAADGAGPRSIAVADIGSLQPGDYVRIAGLGYLSHSDTGGIVVGESSDGRVEPRNPYGITMAASEDLLEGEDYLVEAPTAQPGAYADTFAQRGEYDFFGMYVVLSGHVDHVLVNSHGDTEGFVFADAVVEDMYPMEEYLKRGIVMGEAIVDELFGSLDALSDRVDHS